MKSDIRVYDTLGSTNDEALRMGREGQTGPLWVVALEQTNGRGRRGRSWIGAPGNLFATGLFTIPMPPHEAATISFVAAIALAETLDHWVAPDRIRLKWPNDVEIDGYKCSGILIESHSVSKDVTRLAVGIGVNLVTAPDVEGRTVMSVAAAMASAASGLAALEPVAVASRLAQRFDVHLEAWRAGGFAGIRDQWLARARGIGEAITVNLDKDILCGRFITVSEAGALRIAVTNDMVQDIYAGDVFFGAA